MYPSLRDGDWVFVNPSAPVRAGHIAVFERDGTTVVHRVVSVRLGLEMGDACRHANRFRPEQVLGRVVALARGGHTIDLTTPHRAWVTGRLRWIRSVGWLGSKKLGRIASRVLLTEGALRATGGRGRS